MLCLVALLLLASTALSGCRYSDTLLEVILDSAGVLEANATPEYHEVEGAPLNPDLASVHLSENENLADQLNSLPVYKEDAPLNGQAMRRSYEAQTAQSTDAVSGNEQGDSIEENTATSEQNEPDDDIDAAGEGQGSEEEQSSGEEGEVTPDQTAGRGGTGQVFGDGDYDELPEARAVAAKGQYALITQMLAGKGGLAGADASWIADMQGRGAFPGEGIDELAAFWDAEGNLDVEALIASHADAILVDGVDVILDDEENAALTEAGVNIVHVPVLGQTYTPDKDIVTAVKVVGQVLSGINSEASLDTAAMVEGYIAQHDTAINGCINNNDGYSYKMTAPHLVFQGIYQGTSTTGDTTTKLSSTRITTACIDSWTTTSGSSMNAKREYGFKHLYLNGRTIDTSDGVGLSAQTVGGNFILADYYLQVSGIVNNAYDAAKPVSTTAGAQESHPYAVMAGSSDGVTPRQVGVRQVPSALWYSQTGGDIMDPWITVGDADFPGIIVRDEQIAQSVERSASKENGLYNVGQPYQIYQIPNGVAGNWFDGNVESFLMAPWAYGLFREHDYDTARDWIDEFYRAFYRVDNGTYSYLSGFGAETTAQCPADPSLIDE